MMELTKGKQEGPPPPPPPSPSKKFLGGKTKLCRGNSILGHFWDTNPWIFDSPTFSKTSLVGPLGAQFMGLPELCIVSSGAERTPLGCTTLLTAHPSAPAAPALRTLHSRCAFGCVPTRSKAPFLCHSHCDCDLIRHGDVSLLNPIDDPVTLMTHDRRKFIQETVYVENEASAVEHGATAAAPTYQQQALLSVNQIMAKASSRKHPVVAEAEAEAEAEAGVWRQMLCH